MSDSSSSSLHQEQLRARQRLLSASTGEDPTGSMVKMIAERVYFHMRSEFHDSEEKQILTRIKKSLLLSTDDMLNRVVLEYSVSLKNTVPAENTAPTQRESSQSAESNISNSLNKVSPSALQIVSKYNLHFSENLPFYFISYAVVNSKENVVRGLLVDGEYVTYEMLVSRTPTGRSQDTGRKSLTIKYSKSLSPTYYQVERRNSEMKKLHISLARNYQSIIIPPFPSKFNLIQQKDSVVEQRKRAFSLWLGYIANDSDLQNDNDIISLSSGIHATINEWPIGDRPKEIAQGFLDPIKFARFYVKTSDSVNSSTNSVEIQVLRDIHAIKRDLKRIQSDSNETVDACRSVLQGLVKLKSSIRNVQQSVINLEGLDSTDALLAQILSPALALADDRIHRFSELLSYHLLEPAHFLYESVLPHANDLCERVSKHLPNQFASNAAAKSGTTADDTSPFPPSSVEEEEDISFGVNKNSKRSDSIRQTISFIRSYDYFTKYRAYSVFQNLKDLSAHMVQQHSSSLQYWQNLMRELGCTEAVSNATKSIVGESNFAARKNDLREEAPKNFTSSNSSQRNSTWSYVRTLLDRPIIPTGARKPPDIRRYSNRNHGGYLSSHDSRGNLSQDTTNRPDSGQSNSSSNNNSVKSQFAPSTTTTAASASGSHKGLRKAHHRAAPVPSSAVGSAGNFYVKAPTPASTLSSATFAEASFTGRSYASDSLPAAPPGYENIHASSATAGGSSTSNKRKHQTNSSAASANKAANNTSVHFSPDDLSDPVETTPRSPRPTQSPEPTLSDPRREPNGGSQFRDTNNNNAFSSSSSSSNSSNANFVQDLPEGWEATITDDGRVYYYNVHTRVSRWDAPTEEVAIVVRERVQKTKDMVDEAVQRRKQELKDQQDQQLAASNAAAAIRPELQKAIQQWRFPKHLGRERDIGELLSSLHTIVCSVSQEMFAGNSTDTLTATSPSSEIKRAYLKAARCIHPDKFTADMVLEERLIAEEVFVVLSDAYNTYKLSHDLV